MRFCCVNFADSDSGVKEKKKIGGGTPIKILVAFFSWLNEVIKQGLVRKIHPKQQLLSSFRLPEEAKIRINMKFVLL